MTKQITWEEFTNKVSVITNRIRDSYEHPYNKFQPCLSEITCFDDEVFVASYRPSFYLHFKKDKTLLLSRHEKSIKLRENISYDEMLDILSILTEE